MKRMKLEIPETVSCPNQTYYKQTNTYSQVCFFLGPTQTEFAAHGGPGFGDLRLAPRSCIPPD